MSDVNFDKVEFTVEGVECTYLPMMAKQSRNLLVQLLNKVGPVIGESLKGLKNAGEFAQDSDVSVLIGALADSIGGFVCGFSDAITPGFYENMLDEFLPRVQMTTGEGMKFLKKDVRDVVFSRKLFLETKILLKCLEAQYEDFFALSKTELWTLVGQLAKRKESPSTSPQPSTGISTESPQATGITSP